MAEIVRFEQRRVTRTCSQSWGDSAPDVVEETTVVVRSIHGYDVSVIRDFVRALDVAGAPGTALLEHQTNNGHLTRLTARLTERPDPPEPLDSEPPDPPDPPV
ncbi:hypothetical protein GA0070622_1209 [Micromonospora sediminicola]|uniref:Uncharacterized protein n=1 Tax=Micromonospora sediminicola TaxID=946078 RepID=A0A1A9B5D2_9ACTN|nr:hypothetical protein [Micromonospora sediminicola]SBT64239.1 hypothetical protein GA0070622_1209 [Micromonospora sediminicola]